MNVLVFGGINTMLAVALNLLLGYAGQISLGQAAFFGLGAYISGVATATYGMNTWAALGSAAAVVGLVAFAIGFPILKLKGHYLAMATLGFGIIVYIAFNETVELTGGPSGLTGIPYFTAGTVQFDSDMKNYYLIWGFALMTILLSVNLVKPEARRFALQWGILVIEPDRLPFIVLHDLAGRYIEDLLDVTPEEQDEIWREVPKLIVPLQERIRRFASLLTCNEQSLGDHRIDCAIGRLQRVAGDYLWTAMEHQNPDWLEHRFDAINDALNLDGMARSFMQTRAIPERPCSNREIP